MVNKTHMMAISENHRWLSPGAKKSWHYRNVSPRVRGVTSSPCPHWTGSSSGEIYHRMTTQKISASMHPDKPTTLPVTARRSAVSGRGACADVGGGVATVGGRTGGGESGGGGIGGVGGLMAELRWSVVESRFTTAPQSPQYLLEPASWPHSVQNIDVHPPCLVATQLLSNVAAHRASIRKSIDAESNPNVVQSFLPIPT